MKQSRAISIWEIFYPIGIYYAAQFIGVYLLAILFPSWNQQPLIQQLTATLFALPMIYWFFYRPDILLRVKIREKTSKKRAAYLLLLTTIGGIFFSIALNNMLSLIQIAKYSSTYDRVQESFHSGTFILQIVTLCIVVPFTEEFLFREIIYGRCKRFLSRRKAILLSALLFGIIHVNIVQLVYASIFGILLAFFYDAAGGLKAAAIAHMAANFTSILRSETEVLSFLEGGGLVQLFWMVFFLMLSVLMVCFIRKYGFNTKETAV